MFKKTALLSLALLLLFSALSPNYASAIKCIQSKEYDDPYYRLQPYDEVSFIQINSEGKEKVYSKVPVLPNGYLTLPGYGEIDVFDKTIAEVKEGLELKADEKIDLLVTYHQRHHVSVIGEVKKPGSYSVKDLLSIYDAIGAAGGFTNLANKRKVKVIRQYRDGTREDYYINFPKQVFEAYDAGIGIEKYTVREDDIIYVPRSILKTSGKVMLSLLNYVTLGVISGIVTAAVN